MATKQQVNVLSTIISTFTLPATTEKFVVRKKFVVDTKKEAKVKISFLSKDFQRMFGGKVEEPSAGSIVYGRKLNRNSVDTPILEELGGKRKAATTLTEVYAIMEHTEHYNGESSDLKNGSSSDVFYVPEDDSEPEETLRAVYLDRDDEGWIVRADLVEVPLEWDADDRVFSHNSSAPQAV